MEKIVIWGAGNTGKAAYWSLRNEYEIIYFVDSDFQKWGGSYEGVEIKNPQVLKENRKIKVIIASIYWKEIKEELKKICGVDISIFRRDLAVMHILEDKVISELNKRCINLGEFLSEGIVCRALTFMPGGSSILDYAFLKKLAEKTECKNYLEIGTYIGESINILTDCCDNLYSITAPMEADYSMKNWCKNLELPHYSNRLVKTEKIKQFCENSQTFDYTKIPNNIDLYFIDGDHSYHGIYTDTCNVFKHRRENSIVVWHDFRLASFQLRVETVKAVRDALGEQFKNVYVTDHNICGIYLPKKYEGMFSVHELKYEENVPLYTWDVKLSETHLY